MTRGVQNQAINVLRTVAAVLVVMGHLRALFFLDYDAVAHSPINALFYAVSGLGHEAVVVFFVLSGYWVGGAALSNIRSGTFQWVEYAVQRLTRLWLVLFPGLAVSAISALVIMRHFGGSDVAGGSLAYHGVAPANLDHRAGISTAIGNLFFLQGITVPTYAGNGPLWSLAYEFWFYVLFPLLALIVTASHWRARIGFAVALVACSALIGPEMLAYFPIWLLGAAIASARAIIIQSLSGFSARKATSIRLVCIGALVASMLAASSGQLGSLGDPVVALATALLICTILQDARPRGRSGTVVRWVANYADASFSLYVIHLPLLALLAAATFPAADDRLSPSLTSISVFAGLLTATLLVGLVFAIATEFQTARVRRRLSAMVRNL